jgi:citrate lyase beta subunit
MTAAEPSTRGQIPVGRPGQVFDAAFLDRLDADLAAADAGLVSRYPGDRGGWQPVHTVYLPAGDYRPGVAGDWGARALETLDEVAVDPEGLAATTGVATERVAQVWALVRDKLSAEPIEDLRIDFEDGYPAVGDEQQDADAIRSARELAADWAAGTAPRWAGIRFRSLEAATRRRGLRTLDLFLSSLLDAAGGLPAGLRLTLPKVTSADQVTAMVAACEHLESHHGLPAGALAFELQIETPQAILAADGSATVARMIHAAGGRCSGLHYGTYDYSAAVGIAAFQQRMDHPAADHAKAVMQVAAGGTGVPLSDGSTNVLPVGTPESVRAGWELHARLVRRSLDRGYYQGWDLHPAQLVTRYLATYDFYRSGASAAGARIANYLSRQAGGVLDEPATGAALAGFLLRGLACGALSGGEVSAACGAPLGALHALARREPLGSAPR